MASRCARLFAPRLCSAAAGEDETALAQKGEEADKVLDNETDPSNAAKDTGSLLPGAVIKVLTG